MHIRPAILCGLAATAVFCAAPAYPADVVTIDWGATGVFQHQMTVPAGRFAEVCGALTAGSSVSWRFEADAAMDFNVHYHEGQKVTYPEKLRGVPQASGRLAVPASQDYCWMWTNPGRQDVRLTLELRRQ